MTFETQAANQAGQDQLDIIAAEFEHWRSQKKSAHEKIPESLLREAQKLTEHLGVTCVRRRLGITKGQMDKLDALKQADTVNELDFMQLVAANDKTAAPHPNLIIDIVTPLGVKISLSGLSQKDPLALIAKLLEG